MPNPPDNCPLCGADVPPRARACPGCGADEKTGWSEKARYDDLGIPDEEFNYDKFVQEEFAERAPKRKHRWILITGFILLLLTLLALFLPR